MASSSSPTVSVTARWQSQSLSFPFPLSATVAELHSHIALLLNLAPSLKLIGLVKGRLPDPSATLSSLSLPPEVRLLVVGVRAETVSEVRDIDTAFSLQRQQEERREEDRRRQREAREQLEAERVQEAEERQRERQTEYERQRAERERRWREEEMQREQERRERELREEQAGGDVSFTLSCLLSPQAEAKGKLILPPSALQRIVDAKVAFPLTFAVRRAAAREDKEHEEEKKDSGDAAAAASAAMDAVVYLGVADFDSPHASVVLVPASVLSALGIAEGGSVSLSTVTLPKATHITLLPLPVTSSSSSAPRPSPFLSLSPPERSALLEFHLRHHQMLQRGQVIDVVYRRGLDMMRFEVRDTQPADVVSITDSDVVTDVEGLDGQQEMEREAKVQELRLDDEQQGQLQKGHYSYWSAALDDANAAYELIVHSLQGDADVYAVMQEATSLLPDDTFWTWRGVEVGDDRLQLSSEDPAFKAGQLSIAVFAYEADCAFKISIRKLPQPSPAAGSATSSSPSSSLPAADTTVCSNCHKAIPSRSLSLHTVQCLRNNSRCPDCQLVIPTRYLPKHSRLQHAAVACPGCGERVEAAQIGKHRRDLCSARLVECAYCPLLLTAAERGEHSAEDGLFISKCRDCGQVMQRKLMRRHMRLQHGRDERGVTWRDFF